MLAREGEQGTTLTATLISPCNALMYPFVDTAALLFLGATTEIDCKEKVKFNRWCLFAAVVSFVGDMATLAPSPDPLVPDPYDKVIIAVGGVFFISTIVLACALARAVSKLNDARIVANDFREKVEKYKSQYGTIESPSTTPRRREADQARNRVASAKKEGRISTNGSPVRIPIGDPSPTQAKQHTGGILPWHRSTPRSAQGSAVPPQPGTTDRLSCSVSTLDTMSEASGANMRDLRELALNPFVLATRAFFVWRMHLLLVKCTDAVQSAREGRYHADPFAGLPPPTAPAVLDRTNGRHSSPSSHQVRSDNVPRYFLEHYYNLQHQFKDMQEKYHSAVQRVLSEQSMRIRAEQCLAERTFQTTAQQRMSRSRSPPRRWP